MIKRLLLGLIITLGVVFPQILTSQVGVGPAPYCMPNYFSTPCNQPFPSNTPGNGVNDFIHSYNTFGGIVNINNNNTGCNSQNLSGIKNYRLWGCDHYLKTQPGQFITSNFQSGNVYSQGCAVFVDWNNDGVFNQAAFTGAVPGGERVTQTAGVAPAAVITPMPGWTVPNVPNGTYRMRVRCAYVTSGPFIQPCSGYTYGECEDYLVYINTNPSTMTVNLTSNSPVCLGSQVNINTSITLGPGSGSCTANTFTYNWTGPMSFTSNVMNPSFTATNVLQSGIYTLNISVPNGCGCGSTNTIQIWVNPNPSTSITNNGPRCQGTALNFSNTVTGGGALTYNWQGPNGFTANTPSISFATSQPSNTGVYNFSVVSTFTNGGTCMATSSSSAAVVPVAQVSVTPSFTQCQGTNINLTSGVPGATSYTWQGPNSYTSSLSSPILNFVTPNQSGNYTVTAYFASNQTSLVCTSSAISNVSIVPMTQVTVTPSQVVCQGSNITFSAGALSNPIYIWQGPNFTSTLQSNSINSVNPTNTGSYSVVALWSIGQVSCSTTANMNIGVVPVNTVTVIPNIVLCEGESTILTATAQGANSYTWQGPNSFSVTQPNAQFSNLNSGFSGNYVVTAAFTASNLTCYSQNQSSLLVKPKINFSLTPVGKLCFNQSVNIVGPSGATSYTWVGPGISSNTQNLFLQNATTTNIGNYTLFVDLNGCKTQSSVFVDVQDPIYWKSAPVGRILCKGDQFTITAQPGGGSGNYAFNWDPYYNISGPTGSVQVGTASGTTFYNISVYDIACPQYTINHQFSITVNFAPKPNFELEKWKGCEPFCNLYDTKLTGQNQIFWEFSNNKVYSGDKFNLCLDAGTYTPVITTIGGNGCKEKFKQSEIVVYPKPRADFNYIIMEENMTQFTPNSQSVPVTYLWDLGNIQSTDKVFNYQFPNQGTFVMTLLMNTENDCKDTVTKSVRVIDDFSIYIPNAFSPNSDGGNDTFTPKGTGMKWFFLQIYDRWGSLVFSGKDVGWDGTFKGVFCKDDVYVYKIVVEKSKPGEGKKEYVGHVTLVK